MAGFQENFISVVDEDFQCCICRFPLREPLQLGDADTVSVASDSKMLQQGLKINLSLSLLFTIGDWISGSFVSIISWLFISSVFLSKKRRDLNIFSH